MYIDVWEDIDNSLHTFRELNDAEKIVSHIRSDFKRELIGLMSLYPGEWRYRDPLAFDDVCGPNIAIDTDDFVLANENMSVVFGVYGIRGEEDTHNEAEVKWKEHLAEVRKRYNVSWAEYLLILEMALARRSTITAALDHFVSKTELDADPDNINVDDIKANAQMSLRVTRMCQAMNAVQYARFVSHKIMFEKTLSRIGVEKQSRLLDDTIKKIDASLKNIREMNNWRKSGRINAMVMLLSLLSGLSLITILFQELDIKILSANPDYADSSKSVAMMVVTVCAVLIAVAILWIGTLFVIEGVEWFRRKKWFKREAR